jgi:hypothetical protein
MAAMDETPQDLLESMAALHLPPKADRRLQALMDLNTNGSLSTTEREELESLVEISETIAPMRARALHLLGRKPR